MNIVSLTAKKRDGQIFYACLDNAYCEANGYLFLCTLSSVFRQKIDSKYRPVKSVNAISQIFELTIGKIIIFMMVVSLAYNHFMLGFLSNVERGGGL